MHVRDRVYVCISLTDVIYERWAKIKPEVKKQMGHTMHISVFWRHILLRQQDNNPTTIWAVDMGFLDSKFVVHMSDHVHVWNIHVVEIVESVKYEDSV